MTKESKIDLSNCTTKVKEEANRASGLSNFIAILRANQLNKLPNYIGHIKHKLFDLIIDLSDYSNASNKCVNDSSVSNWRQIACLTGVRIIN